MATASPMFFWTESSTFRSVMVRTVFIAKDNTTRQVAWFQPSKKAPADLTAAGSKRAAMTTKATPQVLMSWLNCA
eukprot:CAMPEP_0175558662 /NCGR_PEP_ID=MMETSP0096-20121207/36003_1 /TAXON_ID=311494 /ORGANISM="Alexandrium monilatum, Strain CCMP3105" /LENGTH=74 /DNA_ID=CAMNT_0016861843 /DNA_START=1 /DNA_END=225 /DNA_ORIENTATION=-